MIRLSNPSIPDFLRHTQRSTEPSADLRTQVADIMHDVKQRGDDALRHYTHQWDGWDSPTPAWPLAEWSALARLCPPSIQEALQVAAHNIELFHSQAKPQDSPLLHPAPGIECRLEWRPLERVGLYVPGGSAPLLSTVLMLGIPARIAGCSQVVLCTPPQANGEVNPGLLYAAELCGVRTVYRVGGAQAIAAMAYGTATIPRVDKIFGPGNAYVTQAKLLAQLAGVPIDMPAGPSELLIIADTTCNPAFVAADLLSQAEHGPDSQVVLIAISSTDILEAVDKEIKKLLATLPRQAIARKALAHSVAVCVEDAAHAIALANAYAPEHLSLQLANPNQWLGTITNAGSVFVGHWSAEAFGDYATGPNHTLPTSGYARSYSGLSVHSFMRSQSVQWVHRQGVPAIAPAVATLAACEGLDAHRIAAQLRLDAFEQPGFPSIDGSQQ